MRLASEHPPVVKFFAANSPVVRFVEPTKTGFHPEYAAADFNANVREVRLEVMCAAVRVNAMDIVHDDHRRIVIDSLARQIAQHIAAEVVPCAD
jgi:hypothetical protein